MSEEEILQDMNFENKKTNRFLLAINKPTESDEEMLEYLKSLDVIKYAIFQREKTEIFEKEHFHIFLILKERLSFLELKKLFPTAFIFLAIGSNEENKEYCSKLETRVSGPYEIGMIED